MNNNNDEIIIRFIFSPKNLLNDFNIIFLICLEKILRIVLELTTRGIALNVENKKAATICGLIILCY